MMPTISAQVLQDVARELHDHKLIKFGEFTLKSGIVSPFYIDLREVQSYPSTLKAVTKAYAELMAGVDESVFIAGIPEGGVPLATAVGYELSRPLVQPRKVVKDHGTKSAVEGAFQQGDKVVLIDDLITKGDSKLEAIAQVESAGLVIKKFLVLIDREQGGMELVREKGYIIEAAMTISALLEAIKSQGGISDEQYAIVMDFIRAN